MAAAFYSEKGEPYDEAKDPFLRKGTENEEESQVSFFVIEEKVIVELKAVKTIASEHQAQIINYLNTTGIEVGLLINFGNPKLEYKRFTRSKDFKHG